MNGNKQKKSNELTIKNNVEIEKRSGDAKDRLANLLEKSKQAKRKNVHILGLVDATSSMDHIWSQTKEIIETLLKKTSEYGDISMKWVAYRDYDVEPDELIQPSSWEKDPTQLISFFNKIKCHGGGDFPEAIEKALQYATQEHKCASIFLIGDAPPHEEKDYKVQAQILGQQNKKVYSFVVGDESDTVRTFAEISNLTGGVSCLLTSVDDILPVLELLLASNFGKSQIDDVLKRLNAPGQKLLPENVRDFARKLLNPPKK